MFWSALISIDSTKLYSFYLQPSRSHMYRNHPIVHAAVLLRYCAFGLMSHSASRSARDVQWMVAEGHLTTEHSLRY